VEAKKHRHSAEEREREDSSHWFVDWAVTYTGRTVVSCRYFWHCHFVAVNKMSRPLFVAATNNVCIKELDFYETYEENKQQKVAHASCRSQLLSLSAVRECIFFKF
jgi:hypothetical protein